MKKINLSIQKPCSENWSGFTPTRHGGFCSSCSREVIDFTSMSDEELLSFLSNRPSGVCGRFRSAQLTTYVQRPAVHTGWPAFRTGVVALFLGLVSLPSIGYAHDRIRVRTDQVHVVSDLTYLPKDSTLTVRGTVKAEDGEVLPGTSVILKGSEVGTVTDGEGRFEFPRKLKVGDVLVFSYIGMAPVEFRVDKNAVDPVSIGMIMEYVLMGDVSVDVVYERPSFFKRVWSRVTNRF
ncbi:MAG: carboxypeptidase-like regulatory domain-containing protein [Cyclobacteriaceae bacterium]